jgi:hypothetical protein
LNGAPIARVLAKVIESAPEKLTGFLAAKLGLDFKTEPAQDALRLALTIVVEMEQA